MQRLFANQLCKTHPVISKSLTSQNRLRTKEEMLPPPVQSLGFASWPKSTAVLQQILLPCWSNQIRLTPRYQYSCTTAAVLCCVYVCCALLSNLFIAPTCREFGQSTVQSVKYPKMQATWIVSTAPRPGLVPGQGSTSQCFELLKGPPHGYVQDI